MSGLWETQVSMIDIMKADDPLMSKVDEIRDTEVPNTIQRPNRYLVVGEIPGEVSSSTFGRLGKDSLLWIHIWHNGIRNDGAIELGKRLPLLIVDDLERLFNRKRIPLDVWTMQLGEINLVRLTRDPNIEYMHGIMQYRILNKAPVAQ